MPKTFTFLFLTFFTLTVNAQQIAEVLPYGQIDTADLRMTSCSFEKDANAMVLFDNAVVSIDEYGVITFIEHKRIKIFNDNGKDEATISIPFIDGITDIKAETINLNNNIIEYTPVDRKLIYQQKTDKTVKILAFAFPRIRSGSVEEFTYKWEIKSWYLPHWLFQSDIPTRYSEIKCSIYDASHIDVVFNVSQPFVKDTDNVIGSKDNPVGKSYTRALSNVPSFKEEPFMPPIIDNLQRAIFKSSRASWIKVSSDLVSDDDFGEQLKDKIPDEENILDKIKLLKNPALITDSIFTLVKNRMTWNNKDEWYTVDGIQKAWDRKTGNSTEINLILCRLLTKANIKAYPIVISTPDNGTIDVNNPGLSQFDKTVVCVIPDTTHVQIMDATSKHNLYNQVPFELLDNYGLLVSPQSMLLYSLVRITSDTLAKETVYVEADIKPEGKINGIAHIFSESYNRANIQELYKQLGDKKYTASLSKDNNDLKILSFKMENTDNDKLPIVQTIDFELNLSASDNNYIYFSPNLFSSLSENPFLSETRHSDIDFLYKSKYVISGRYTIPQGYKADAVPANRIIESGDKSISFERLAATQDDVIQVRYVITRTKTLYNKEDYQTLHEFYKKMYAMLNEQIVLKKL